ncbi:MAG: aminotransferase class I/II-fold pyridoxal phosphate-dependent enzyme [Desulfobacterales bacterium]
MLRTFSKAYGLAGIRIGYGVMPSEMAATTAREPLIPICWPVPARLPLLMMTNF